MITKRQLGIGFMGLSVLAAIGTFVLDWWRTSNEQAFTPQMGPVQIGVLVGAVLLFAVGLTLIPLGNKPA